MRPLVPVLLALLLVPPAVRSEEPDKRREEFLGKWGEITSRMRKDDRKTFAVKVVERSGSEFTGSLETRVTAVEDGKPALVSRGTADNAKELEEKGVKLPLIFTERPWPEPMGLKRENDGEVEAVGPIEMKVGEKTLKCTRLTLKLTGRVVTKITIDISAEDDLGLVALSVNEGGKVTTSYTLTSWQRGDGK